MRSTAGLYRRLASASSNINSKQERNKVKKEKLLAKIDSQLTYLDSYKKGLEDPKGIQPESKDDIEDEKLLTQAKIDGLTRLKKTVYSS